MREQRFDLIIALHEDDTSDGLYGLVSGALLSDQLLEPALQNASRLIPRNEAAVINGFPARRGIIREGYRGILAAPPEQRPRALEIVFETPCLAPLPLRVTAAVTAVRTILEQFRSLQAHGLNL